MVISESFVSLSSLDYSALVLDSQKNSDDENTEISVFENCERSFLVFQRFAKDDLSVRLEKISSMKKFNSNVSEAKGIKEAVAIKKINTLIQESMKFIIQIDQKLG